MLGMLESERNLDDEIRSAHPPEMAICTTDSRTRLLLSTVSDQRTNPTAMQTWSANVLPS